MTISEHIGVIPEWTAADRLVKARNHARLTQSQLAARLGISVKSIKRYEAGAAPKRAVLLGWGLTCGVSPRWLETGRVDDDGDDGSPFPIDLPTGREARAIGPLSLVAA